MSVHAVRLCHSEDPNKRCYMEKKGNGLVVSMEIGRKMIRVKSRPGVNDAIVSGKRV